MSGNIAILKENRLRQTETLMDSDFVWLEKKRCARVWNCDTGERHYLPSPSAWQFTNGCRPVETLTRCSLLYQYIGSLQNDKVITRERAFVIILPSKQTTVKRNMCLCICLRNLVSAVA